jgi:hypothetical protein
MSAARAINATHYVSDEAYTVYDEGTIQRTPSRVTVSRAALNASGYTVAADDFCGTASKHLHRI